MLDDDDYGKTDKKNWKKFNNYQTSLEKRILILEGDPNTIVKFLEYPRSMYNHF